MCVETINSNITLSTVFSVVELHASSGQNYYYETDLSYQRLYAHYRKLHLKARQQGYLWSLGSVSDVKHDKSDISKKNMNENFFF